MRVHTREQRVIPAVAASIYSGLQSNRMAMPLSETSPATLVDQLREAIRDAHRTDETTSIDRLVREATLPIEVSAQVETEAARLVRGVRASRRRFGGLDDFLQAFGLSTREGIALMCLAEALLRTPDAETANRLIRDKIGGADWERHVGRSDTLFVNASTWALMLTGKVMRLEGDDGPSSMLDRMVARAGEPVIRQAMQHAMRVLGRQFVMGRNIDEALDRAQEPERQGYRYSYDMLGEAARTAVDAERYYATYAAAIDDIGAVMNGRGPVDGPGISIKLSALHPRFDEAQRHRAGPDLVERLRGLAAKCAGHNMGMTVDAEEADRLELSLDIIEATFADPGLSGWDGFGVAVQAYQKRASYVVDWLAAVAGRAGRRMMVRLVKGAYWDSEIKRAQEAGLERYPVFTRKASTDVSYLACARKLLARRDVLYPQFATHNAHTLAAVLAYAGDRNGFEFQRLHGMGEPLYHQVVGAQTEAKLPCRIYAPVGSHEDLLPYLVRRLLENGANSSFVNRLQDDAVPVENIVADPVRTVAYLPSKPHPKIPLPPDIFQPERRNSLGVDLSDRRVLDDLLGEISRAADRGWAAAPLIGGRAGQGPARPAKDPADQRRVIGEVAEASEKDVERALAAGSAAFPQWESTAVAERASCLERAAELMEHHRSELMALCIREAGKTIPDALAEVREAVDFCRYYAARARRDFERIPLPGPTGESNELELRGRGVFICISPWNFPLAIFTGQVVAALVSGNTVIAKPAEQTPLIAMRAVQLMHEAGIPAGALSLVPGEGSTIGAALVSDPRIGGVAFTGSTETARLINRALAERNGPIIPLIAETGGQNAMIVDNTALPEQVVDDVITSAFRSTGQRCSALRVLFLQDGISDRIIEMLDGAAQELIVGDPMRFSTDVGPVIDRAQLDLLQEHASATAWEGRLRTEVTLPPGCDQGFFFAPRAFEIDDIGVLTKEVFGPILHIVRFRREKLGAVLDAINDTGYGLTLGIHSRIDETVEEIHSRLRVGNTYVNRSMIGAVVGVQPFGGEGLSGTGPKAGGPHYLQRFATERTLTVNTTASGGNTTLVSLTE